jgi:hypothetical protein
VAAGPGAGRGRVARLDLRATKAPIRGSGVLDVVPFVPYEPGQAAPEPTSARRWRSATTSPAGSATSWACRASSTDPFPAAPIRTLPQVRRHAFARAGGLPDFGPPQPHRTAGATAVGARPVLVAYNVWVSSVEVARLVARLGPGPRVRALGLAVGDRAQVSCNLVDPAAVGPAGSTTPWPPWSTRPAGAVEGGELVGLSPRVLQPIPSARDGRARSVRRGDGRGPARPPTLRETAATPALRPTGRGGAVVRLGGVR